MAWGGIFVTVVGLIVTNVLVSAEDILAAIYMRTGDPIVTGYVDQVTRTNMVTKSKKRFYETRYRYQVGAELHAGHFMDTRVPAIGQTLDVSYARLKPSISVVGGWSAAPTSTLVFSLVLIVPVLGVVLLTTACGEALRYGHLVRNGLITTGRVLTKYPTGSKTNERMEYLVTFQYVAWDGDKRKVTMKTSEIEKLEGTARRRIVYDPRKKSNAVLLDTVPKRVRQYLRVV